MNATDAEAALPNYEGFIFRHALRVVGFVEEDFDDIQQVYRVKAWRALLSFDPAKAPKGTVKGRTPEQRYVFSCLKNMEKDLVKKKRRNEAFIEDEAPATGGLTSRLQSRDRFECRYLSLDHDSAYAEVEDVVLVPNTLTQLELQVVCLLYWDYWQTQVARKLGLGKREMETIMRSIRDKMGDWKPSQGEVLELPSLEPEVRTPVAA